LATSEFKSWNSFDNFSRSVRFKTRFIHDRQVRDFLNAVKVSAERRVFELEEGKALWRAQVGYELKLRNEADYSYEEPVPYSVERMKPLPNSAQEGRVNPRGIACLYAASNKETAVAEARPWMGALVSVAQIGSTRKLRLVSCGEGHDSKLDFYFEEPDPKIREEVVWRAIGREFSKPVGPDIGAAEYAPTQVISEHFKMLGYDGVVYKSKLGSGVNFAFFDLNALEIYDVGLFPVKAVTIEVGDIENSYVVKRRKLKS